MSRRVFQQELYMTILVKTIATANISTPYFKLVSLFQSGYTRQQNLSRLISITNKSEFLSTIGLSFYSICLSSSSIPHFHSHQASIMFALIIKKPSISSSFRIHHSYLSSSSIHQTTLLPKMQVPTHPSRDNELVSLFHPSYIRQQNLPQLVLLISHQQRRVPVEDWIVVPLGLPLTAKQPSTTASSRIHHRHHHHVSSIPTSHYQTTVIPFSYHQASITLIIIKQSSSLALNPKNPSSHPPTHDAMTHPPTTGRLLAGWEVLTRQVRRLKPNRHASTRLPDTRPKSPNHLKSSRKEPQLTTKQNSHRRKLSSDISIFFNFWHRKSMRLDTELLGDH